MREKGRGKSLVFFNCSCSKVQAKYILRKTPENYINKDFLISFFITDRKHVIPPLEEIYRVALLGIFAGDAIHFLQTAK